HYIGDIGLIGAKVPVPDDGDSVEGYDIVVGGGFADAAKIGRELWKGVKAEDAPSRVAQLLAAWQGHRADPAESFHAFSNRLDNAVLKQLAEAEVA
ncbi:MAG: NirA family protein, partial [Beijerinckiaceae bacterium]